MSTTEFLLRIAVFGWCILVLWWVFSGINIYHPKFFPKIFNVFKKKIIYEKHKVGGNARNAWQQELIHKNRNLLSENHVPLDKIRFVFQPCFQYDIDSNQINPAYDIFFPIHTDTGLFVKGSPIIEKNKPLNIMSIVVGNYQMADNYAYLKETLKRCKRGIVIFITDEMVNDLITGEPMPYKFSVDDEVIRFAVLDDALEHYKNT